MGIIGKLFKNKQIVTIVALIACFAILVFAYRYRVNKAISAVNVPIATKTIKARELIDESCFETKKVAQAMLTNNVIRNSKDLVGDEGTPAKYVNYNTFIPEGSMFYTSAVTTWNHMPDSAWSDLEEGQTVFSLSADAESTYGNSIYPGDKIDLYYSGYNENKYFIGPLIKGITVLAVKDENGSHIFKKSHQTTNTSALIFAVDNEKFLFLKRAESSVVGGTIIPVPRNANYTVKAEEAKGSEFIRSFIENNSHKSVDDAIITNNSKSNVNITE